MAGTPPPVPFDWDAAHQAGFSDAQIITSLHEAGKIPDWDIESAYKHGVTPSQLVQAMGGKPGESGFVDSALQGLTAPAQGLGKTIETHFGPNVVSDALQKGAAAIAPPTYTPAPLYDKQGFHPDNIPSWLGANAPSMYLALKAAKATPGPWWAKALGGAAAGFLMNAGNEDQQAATNATGNPDATPTWGNVARGDLASAASSAVGSLPFARYLPGANKLAKVGAAGVGQAAGRFLGTVADQAAANAGGSAAEQAIQTGNVDPTQTINAAAGGALGGTAFSARPALKTALNAAAFRGITNDPENRIAAAQVANQIKQYADGQNLNGGLVLVGNAQRAGKIAMDRTAAAVKGNLADTFTSASGAQVLPTEVRNIVEAAQRGEHTSPTDYATLQNATQDNPYGPALINAVRQAQALRVFQGLGHEVGNKFKGGIEGITDHILTGENVSKSAIVGGMAALAEEGAGHIIAYSPHVIGAALAARALGRMADAVTGAHTPAGRVVSNFAGPVPPSNFNPPVPAGASVPSVPQGGPLPPTASPWGVTPPMTPNVSPSGLTPFQAQQMKMAANLPLRALAAQAGPKGMVRQALPLLRQLAAQGGNAPQAPTAPAAAAPVVAPPMQPSFVPPKTAASYGPDVAMALARAKAMAPAIANITKANGKIGEQTSEGDVIPRSPYANLPSNEAAQKIYEDAKKAGTYIARKQGFIAGTQRNIDTIRNMAVKVAGETPGNFLASKAPLPASEIAAQFEGVRTQKQAIEHRELLKRQFPQYAPALDKYFSDDFIKKGGVWTTRGK